MHKILVTGGCGYIGSHTVVDLIEQGYEVVSIDNFLRSNEKQWQRVQQLTGKQIRNYAIDLCDASAVQNVLEKESDSVGIIHFAALRTVPESVQHPLLYYTNNIQPLANLLNSMQQVKIKNLVFSSSCSVYGNPDSVPVTEDTLLNKAESPYAYSKQICEQMITDVVASGADIKPIALRYFNPVGAHPSGLLGEVPWGKPNNLVPYITQTAIGKLPKLTVFGGDYPTRDGSAVRDYIHIMDIAGAHRLALEFLLQQKGTKPVELFNLGTGNGVTVLEAIHAFEASTGQKLNYEIGPRRAGDPATIFANNGLAKECLGWQPQYSIQEMMLSAWKWEQEMAKIN